jgi:hypothetical protein
LIVGPNRCAALGGLAVNPYLTDAKHLFEGNAITSHRFVKYLCDAVGVDLITGNARCFSRGTEQ